MTEPAPLETKGRTTRRRGRGPSTEPTEIGLPDVMERLALSAKQIQREMAEGMPHRRVGKALRFPWPEARLWRDEHIRDTAAAAAAPRPAQADARGRRAEAEATMAELALEQRRGSLLEVDVHTRLLEDAFARVRARLIAIKPKLGAHGVGHASPIEAQTALSPLIDEVMDELHRSEDVPEPVEQDPADEAPAPLVLETAAEALAG